MKKFFLVVVVLFFATFQTIVSQNFDKVENLSKDKKWSEAYSAIMETKAKDKKGKLENEPTYFYWMGHVLAQSAIESKKIDALQGSLSDQLSQGFDNLKKAYDMKKDLPLFILGQSSPYADFWSIYIHTSQNGINFFNDKKYNEALVNFDIATTLSQFLANNELGMTPIDSNLIYLKSLTYINLKNTEGATPLVKTLADIKYQPVQTLEMIKWILFQAMESKNQNLFNEFKQIGSTAFPEHNDDLWNVIEDEYKLNMAKDAKEKLSVYQSLIAAGGSQRIKYNYVVDAYQYIQDKKSTIKDDEYKSLLTSMQPVAVELFATDSKNFTTLYLYQVALFGLVEGINIDISNLRKELREKAAPVQGNAPKGSKLEKELNNLKKQIEIKQADLKVWANKAFPSSDQLVQHLESMMAGAENNVKVQLENSLDIASGLAYYAGLDSKADLYEQKRKTLSKNRK